MLTHTFPPVHAPFGAGAGRREEGIRALQGDSEERTGVRVTSVSSRVYPLNAQVMPATNESSNRIAPEAPPHRRLVLKLLTEICELLFQVGDLFLKVCYSVLQARNPLGIP